MIVTHPNGDVPGDGTRRGGMDSDGPAEVDAYLMSSRYRQTVLEHLGTDGPTAPKEIAAATDERRPHISRALGELEDEGVVELRVDEDRRVERYYGLTDEGEAAWERLRDEIRHVPWSVEPPGDSVSTRIVQATEAELGDDLRCVLGYDGERVRFRYVADGILEQYTDEEIERAIQSFVFDHRLDSVTMPHETVRSEAITFTEFSLVRVGRGDSRRFAVTFDNEADVAVPQFTQLLGSILGSSDE